MDGGCKSGYHSNTITSSNQTCYKADGTKVSCFNHNKQVASWNYTGGTKYCYQSVCTTESTSNFGAYNSGCSNSSYFIQSFSNKKYTTDSGVSVTFSNVPLYSTENGKTCLTAEPVTAACAINRNGINTSTGMPKEGNDTYLRFYTYSTSYKRCGNIGAHLATGCNENNLSYPASKFDGDVSNLMDIKPATNGATDTSLFTEAGITKYSDVFTTINTNEAVYNEVKIDSMNCVDCVVACACNAANGWSSSCSNGTNCYTATNKVTMAYKSLTNAMARSAASTNIDTSIDDLIAQGSQGLTAKSAAATTQFDVQIAGASSPLSCYKPKQNFFYDCKYTISRVASDSYDEFVLSSMNCVNKADSSDVVTYNETSSPSITEILKDATQLPTFSAKLKHNFVTYDEPAFWSNSGTAFVLSTARGKKISMATTGMAGLFTKYISLKSTLEFDAKLSNVNSVGFVLYPENSTYTTTLDKYKYRNMQIGLNNRVKEQSELSEFVAISGFGSSKSVGYIATNQLYANTNNYYVQGQKDDDYKLKTMYPAVFVDLIQKTPLITKEASFNLVDYNADIISSTIASRIVDPQLTKPHYKLFPRYYLDPDEVIDDEDYNDNNPRIIVPNSSDLEDENPENWSSSEYNHYTYYLEEFAAFDPTGEYNGPHVVLYRDKYWVSNTWNGNGNCNKVTKAKVVTSKETSYNGNRYTMTALDNDGNGTIDSTSTDCPNDRESFSGAGSEDYVARETLNFGACPSCSSLSKVTHSGCVFCSSGSQKYYKNTTEKEIYTEDMRVMTNEGKQEERTSLGKPLLYVQGGFTLYGMSDEMKSILQFAEANLNGCGANEFTWINKPSNVYALGEQTCNATGACCTAYTCHETLDSWYSAYEGVGQYLIADLEQSEIKVDSTYDPLRGILLGGSTANKVAIQVIAPNGTTCTVHRCKEGEIHDYVVGELPNSSYFTYSSRVFGYTHKTTGEYTAFPVDEEYGDTHCVNITGCANGYTLHNIVPDASCSITSTTDKTVSCNSYEGYYYGIDMQNARFCLKEK